MIDEALRDRLLGMAETDLATRARLAEDGSLFDGYHPEMRAVHERHADALAQLVAEGGWPTEERVGVDGAEAAWLIVQHAISRPAFCREVLIELKRLGEAGEAPRWQAAYLEDRIRVFEGRPQLYGTSFDWDEEGQMSPKPIERPERVDERRQGVGLGPLKDAIAHHRKESAPEFRPADMDGRRREIEAFARAVGWRP
ncbi:MAG TPA: DUF6624 domain-containing protein [Allosphingosinicella sp.]|jgi:hypothetical protein|uniref:DUF6624 domain-containing protein n=1 Tax=Allosphingosinicella sp. TaxID=2823234 RepID=UPI002F276EBD